MPYVYPPFADSFITGFASLQMLRGKKYNLVQKRILGLSLVGKVSLVFPLLTMQEMTHFKRMT